MTQWRELARLDGVAQAALVARGEVRAEELLDARPNVFALRPGQLTKRGQPRRTTAARE